MLFIVIIFKIYFNDQATYVYVYNMEQMYNTVTQVKNGSNFLFFLYLLNGVPWLSGMGSPTNAVGDSIRRTISSAAV